MTKQKLTKVAEVALLSLFCLLAVYITLVSTVLVGTSPVVTHSMNVAADRFVQLKYLKRNAAMDKKGVAILIKAVAKFGSNRETVPI
jgi:hypothetical protein